MVLGAQMIVNKFVNISKKDDYFVLNVKNGKEPHFTCFENEVYVRLKKETLIKMKKTIEKCLKLTTK